MYIIVVAAMVWYYNIVMDGVWRQYSLKTLSRQLIVFDCSFSGDTAPSTNLRRAGANTTVLIHEATMADEEADLAKQKAHTTIGQAIAEGKA